MVGVRHDPSDPLSPALDELRTRGDVLRIREEHLDVGDAILVGMRDDSIPERSELLGVLEDSLLIGVREDISVRRIGASMGERLKDVSSHGDGVLLVVVVDSFSIGVAVFGVVAIGLTDGFSDHVCDNVLLLLGEGGIDVADGLFVFVAHLSSFTVVGMLDFFIELEVQAREDDCFVIENLIGIPMSDTYVVNVCTRVGPVDDKTHFSDCAVNHGRSSTLQLVCVDRQLSNIAMTDEFLGILSLWGIVEYRVGVDAVRSMFEFRMT